MSIICFDFWAHHRPTLTPLFPYKYVWCCCIPNPPSRLSFPIRLSQLSGVQRSATTTLFLEKGFYELEEKSRRRATFDSKVSRKTSYKESSMTPQRSHLKVSKNIFWCQIKTSENAVPNMKQMLCSHGINTGRLFFSPLPSRGRLHYIYPVVGCQCHH